MDLTRMISLAAVCAVLVSPLVAREGPAMSGNDRIHLKRFDVVDQQGFAQPLTVASFLAPADWRLEGGVQWNFNTDCTMEIVSMQVRVSSPDGRESFEVFPQFSAFWSDNPQFRQFMANKGCRTGPAFSSEMFIRELFLPGFRPDATVSGVKALPDLARAEYQKQMAMYGQVMDQMQATVTTDVTQATLTFRDQRGEREEWVVAVIHSAQGQQYDEFSGGAYGVQTTSAERVVSYQAPAGQLARRNGLFATIIGSYRINPVYLEAVRNVRNRMNQIAMQGLIDRQRIIHQMNQQVQQSIAANWDNQVDAWKRRSASNDRTHEKWIEMIRGTESYADPSSPGTTWELSSGFSNVWKTGSDQFILTNDVNFDPNVSLNGQWTRMSRAK